MNILKIFIRQQERLSQYCPIFFHTRLTSQPCRGPRDLQVISTRFRIQIYDFAGKKKIADSLRLHCFRINFKCTDPTGSDDRFPEASVTFYLKPQVLHQ
jgi:hypothetical protein